MMDHLKRGKDAETKAWHWLIQQGLKPIKRNHLCKMGEIDLIMLDSQPNEDTLVFVEVRMRSTNQFGGAVSSITASKQRKIIKAAQHFLMTQSRYQNHNCRFDVVTYESIADDSQPVWYKDAFTL